MKIQMRRALSCGTAGLLIAGFAAVAPSPALAADLDPRPVTIGAAWLKAQLTDGVVHNDQYNFDDYGLSVDVAFALEAVGESAAVSQVASAVAENLNQYTAYGYDPAPASGESRHVLAGSTAKAAVLADIAGEDATDFGGVDLVAQLEQLTQPNGRIADTYNPAVAYEADFANTLGQAYAVRTLSTNDSSEASAAADYLIDQQCSSGSFRLNFSAADAALQTCEEGAPGSEPDTDATAIALQALNSIPTPSVEVQAAIALGKAWLQGHQLANGSFGGGPSTEAPNANSTGLAAWVLDELGATSDATEAAVWLRGLQVDEQTNTCAGPLGSSRATGAVAYDAAALAAARTAGIEVSTEDQWRRAASQTLPALALVPVGAPAAERTLKVCSTPSGYLKGGSRFALTVAGQAGHTIKVSGTGISAVSVTATGAPQKVSLVLPKRTGDLSIKVESGIQFTSAKVSVLAAKNLKVVSKRTAVKGKKHKVVVKGLAMGEKVTVKLGAKKVGSGKANSKGVWTKSFRVTAKKGVAKLKATGQFSNRTGTKKVTIK